MIIMTAWNVACTWEAKKLAMTWSTLCESLKKPHGNCLKIYYLQAAEKLKKKKNERKKNLMQLIYIITLKCLMGMSERHFITLLRLFIQRTCHHWNRKKNLFRKILKVMKNDKHRKWWSFMRWWYVDSFLTNQDL